MHTLPSPLQAVCDEHRKITMTIREETRQQVCRNQTIWSAVNRVIIMDTERYIHIHSAMRDESC